MRSKILVTAVELDRGLEPVIKLAVSNSDDARDSLLKGLMQSARSANPLVYLRAECVNSKNFTNDEGFPDIENHYLLRCPEEGSRMLCPIENAAISQALQFALDYASWADDAVKVKEALSNALRTLNGEPIS